MSEQKKPLRETEQLKKNTEMEYAKQRTEEFEKFLLALVEDTQEKFRWKLRAETLEFIVLLFHLLVILLCSIFTDYETWGRVIVDWSFLLFLLVAVRAMLHHASWARADGKLEGALETLEMLDMAKIDRGDHGEVVGVEVLHDNQKTMTP